MTMQTKSDAEIDAEIAALEASIERVQIPEIIDITEEIEALEEIEEPLTDSVDEQCSLVLADFCEYDTPDVPDDFDPFHTIEESNNA